MQNQPQTEKIDSKLPAGFKKVESLDDFKQELTNAGDLAVFADFAAEWCGNC